MLGAALATGSAAAEAGRPAASHEISLADPPIDPGQPAAVQSAEELAAAYLIAGESRRSVIEKTGLKRWQVDQIAARLGLTKAAQAAAVPLQTAL